MPATGCTLPAAQASTLCEVAALDEENPAEPLSLYDEDYFAGHPAVAVHRYGKGRAYYLASRFDEAFYRAFYHDAAKEPGLAGGSARRNLGGAARQLCVCTELHGTACHGRKHCA